jgi:nucleoside-diphosphate-sugar epimerase
MPLLCREKGEPFIFPGSQEQWNALTDVTDARILAQQLSWAATTPAAYGQAYNISNGDILGGAGFGRKLLRTLVWSGRGRRREGRSLWSLE